MDNLEYQKNGKDGKNFEKKDNPSLFEYKQSELFDASAAEVQARIDRQKMVDQAEYKRLQAQQERERYAEQAEHQRLQAQQERERYADRAARGAKELHEEEQKEALIRYIGSSAKIDPQDLMEYIDSLKQSGGMEESQISKGRTK